MNDYALKVERVSVQKGRISLLVRAAEGAQATNNVIAQRLNALRPTLAHHTCVNPKGSTFGAVMDATSLPHVLEHLIIDEQVRDARTSADAIFVGTTEWLNEAAGLARVEVNFADDLVALQALQNALAFINNEVLSCLEQ